MRITGILLGALLCELPLFMSAQDVNQLIEEEHRYQFTVSGAIDAQAEKIMVEAISGFDPRMHVDIDRPYNLMKVLTYQPVDAEAMVVVAAQFGVTLSTRRIELEPEEPKFTEQ
ncbi:MAG: hypothetical protein IT226_15295 [Flavobacteriales bacterium]|nr:hypothetical protein [Flavobacteriales bacterium]